MATTVKPLTLGLAQRMTAVLGLAWANWTRDISNASVLQGTGNPTGVIVANCGALFVDTAGLVNAVLWVKEDPVNNGTAVGWRAL